MIKCCPKCGHTKTSKDFYLRKLGKPTLSSWCKMCYIEYLGIKRKYMYKKFPWTRAYDRAKQRCTSPKKSEAHRYKGRGIKFLMTREDFKKLWFRDKAYGMERPSIDRIDPDGHYQYNNCQYIEFIENCREGGYRKRRH